VNINKKILSLLILTSFTFIQADFVKYRNDKYNGVSILALPMLFVRASDIKDYAKKGQDSLSKKVSVGMKLVTLTHEACWQVPSVLISYNICSQKAGQFKELLTTAEKAITVKLLVGASAFAELGENMYSAATASRTSSKITFAAKAMLEADRLRYVLKK